MKLATPHRGGVRRDQDRRVHAESMTSSEEERAMPPDDFNAGAIGQLGTAANAILVGPAVDMRAKPGPSEHAWGDPVHRPVYRRLKLRYIERGWVNLSTQKPQAAGYAASVAAWWPDSPKHSATSAAPMA